MARRKRSGSVTHKRVIIGNAKPPKGRKWRKVSSMLDTLVTEHGHKAMGLDIFQFLGTLSIRYGNKGSAVTDYAWGWYLKHGYSLGEQGMLEHIDGGRFGRWLNGIHTSGDKGWKVIETHKPKLSRKAKAKAASRVSESDKAKAIGDRIRAENAEAKKRQAEYAKAYWLQQDTMDIWRRISKGEFPLGETAFKAELARLAKVRADSTSKVR